MKTKTHEIHKMGNTKSTPLLIRNHPNAALSNNAVEY